MTVRRIVTRPLEGPVPLLDHVPSVVWMSEDRAMVGFGEAARIEPGRGEGRFEAAAERWEDLVARIEVDDRVGLPGTGAVAFGSFTFDPTSGGSGLVVPQVLVGRQGDRWWITEVDGITGERFLHPSGTAPRPLDRPRYAGSSMPDLLWIEAVAEALRHIEAGDVEKVVLARDLAVWAKVPFDPRLLLERLHARFPSCFTFLVDGLVGATPELLVRRRGLAVESVPLAGSAPRAEDPERDEALGKELLASDKDRREHEAAAASVGRTLGELCVHLRRDVEPWLLELDNVRHLATRFEGRLARWVSSLRLAGRLHPTAAVGGTPTAAAVDLIRRLEGMDRGRYAGPVGWVDGHGDGEWAIALRCAELSGARARLFAGAGIVAGSLPESELEETRLKLRAMMGALEP